MFLATETKENMSFKCDFLFLEIWQFAHDYVSLFRQLRQYRMKKWDILNPEHDQFSWLIRECCRQTQQDSFDRVTKLFS